MKIALAQINPTLGNVEKNLEAVSGKLELARERGAELVVFPELCLTGYFLKDMIDEVAVRLKDKAFKKIKKLTKGLDAVVSFVESDGLGSHFISAAYLSDGDLTHVHRKVYLPTYGMFEDGRFFAAGEKIRAFDCRLGRAAILICEDFWHLSSPYIAAMDGATCLIAISNSPARGVSQEADQSGDEPRFESLNAQRSLNRAAAYFFGAYVIYVNRVGYEDGICFAGGSEVINPHGRQIAAAPDLEEALVETEIDLRQVAQARLNTPLVPDEKLELTRRELKRIQNERFKDPY